MEKSLDRKLRAIHADPSGSTEFILADAKDADMAFGVSATGTAAGSPDEETSFKSLVAYRDQIREVIDQAVVDIVLMSASTSEVLTIQERLFDDSSVTPAARANDTSDVHVVRGGRIHQGPSRPFRTATIDHLQCGHLECRPEERSRGVNLGLYSITFNNQTDLDIKTLERFKEFREEAERKGFRYFLEVFDPNVAEAALDNRTPGFVNDLIARTLAGVTRSARPLFLKMVYHGPLALEELVNYDPHLIVGILGGASGTTLDAFQLIHEAKNYGARAALFGRKINNSENQLAFIQFLRLIADGAIEPAEAVRAYHGVLQQLKITPLRTLEDDLTLQTNVMSYGGNGTTISLPPAPKATSTVSEPWKRLATETQKQSPHSGSPASENRDDLPEFGKMSPDERLSYHRQRLDRMFGE